MLTPEEIARRTWQMWLESLELHDGSFETFVDPQPGDWVLEIVDGVRALEAGTFMPASLGILRTPLVKGRGDGRVMLELADGGRCEWTRCQFIKVPASLV
jgi:hypothetical protein